ncbi:MAG: DUF2961 domain-containing protein, partial [Armatimonadota bacterium]
EPHSLRGVPAGIPAVRPTSVDNRFHGDHMRIYLPILLTLLFTLQSFAVPLPPAGSPERLTDWRWLARTPEGRRVTLSGNDKLEALAGRYLLLEVTGPGVLDHLLLRDPDALLSISVDNRPLWEGKVGMLANPPAGTTPLFPTPVFSAGASFYHLLAPIGFRTSLRVLIDKPTPLRYLSYRTFTDPAQVMPADADPQSAYARGLQAAALAWKVPADTFNAIALAPAREVSVEITAGAGAHVPVLNLPGSGEITHLEFNLAPPLTGSLRNLLVELYYDGAREPALRLPITDLVGVPHPWPNGRWDQFNGTLAAGLHYPWADRNIRRPGATFYCNLPIPYARGLRLELVNRSETLAFFGSLRAVVNPLQEGREIGRLCGTRLIAPMSGTTDPLIILPGPGQVVGLGLFCTGNDLYPPAQLNGASWLSLDGAPPVSGVGVVPLWMGGGSGGAVTGLPLWNHPRLEPQYVGAMRNFLTDPLSFDREAAFGYNPGINRTGAPTSATVIALWYRYGDVPYAAPVLPARAESLPVTTFVKPEWYGPEKGARLAATIEAEDLVPLATAHGGEVLAVEDAEQNYHASNGKYLTIRVDRIGDYTDCPFPFPASRYFVIGQTCLTGPVNGRSDVNFELSLLSQAAAAIPPAAPNTGNNFAWSMLGGAPVNLGVFILGSLSYRRDSVDFYPPQLNPAPDGDGVFRFISRGPGATMIRFDQFWLYTPPPTAEGWRECEEGKLPTCEGDIAASLPLTGRLDWSGWGAVALSAKEKGKATISDLLLTGPATPKELRLSGSLAPRAGAWQVTVNGSTAPPFGLTPGKDAKEVVEWTIPVTGLTFPGPVVLEFTYTPPATPQKSQLFLDAWVVK